MTDSLLMIPVAQQLVKRLIFEIPNAVKLLICNDHVNKNVVISAAESGAMCPIAYG